MSAPVQDTRTIVVTGAAGPAGRALGAQFSRHPGAGTLHVVGVDLAPAPVPGFETVEAVPAATDPAYERATIDLLSRHRPDLLLPTVSEELPRLAVLAHAVGLGSTVVLSAPGPTAVAGDKLLTMWDLARHGVAVPRHMASTDVRSASAALDWAGGQPIVVKPRTSRGGRGVHVVEDPQDLVWDRLDGSWIVQEFAPGDEYSPQVYRSPTSGRSVVVVLQKTRLERGRVGNATAVERVEGADDVAALATQAVEALDLVGPLDVDVRRLVDGTPVILEINARFGAVSAAAPELLEAVLADWPG